jgi:hypothetical protein
VAGVASGPFPQAAARVEQLIDALDGRNVVARDAPFRGPNWPDLVYGRNLSPEVLGFRMELLP